MAKIPVSKDKILNLALQHESHPDNITPAVFGGFNTAVADNEKVTFIKYDMPSDLKAVVVIPNIHFSTNHSRTTLSKRVSLKDAVFNISHTSLLTAAIMSKNYEVLKEASKDVIHQEIRMSKMPELFDIQKFALANGSLMSTLSGSGSSFFNMAHIDDAKRLKDKIADNFSTFRVELFDFDNLGLTVE
jgi:homoserine kinase